MPIVNSVTINDVSVPFKDGITISSILSKDLNSGVIVIPDVEKLDIEPLDEVVITHNTNQNEYFLVSTIQADSIELAGTVRFNYTIGVVSPTIKLQRIVLPNRSVTQKITSANNLTIKDVITRYLVMYANDLSISTALDELIIDVVCPDFSWNRPTLFEVLNDLLNVVGAVVTMDDFTTIGYLDLYQDGADINLDNASSISYYRDASEYASAVEVEAQNVYDKNALSKNIEWVTLRSDGDVKITSENEAIQLQKPIFTVDKITALFFNDDVSAFEQLEVDITKYVVRKEVYDLLLSSISTGIILNNSSEVEYRRNALYYSEGDNKIVGFGFREDNWLPTGDTEPAFYNVVYNSVRDAYSGQAPSWFQNFMTSIGDGPWKDKVAFRVEYTSTESVLFRARKEIPIRHESILINGQTESNVYAEALGKQQQEFINRIGNEELTITGKYETFSNIPDLHDKYNDYILTKKEIVFHNSYYLFKGIFSKHYAADNMFAGINTDKRFTEIATANDALVSNHITEYFYEMSFIDKTGTVNDEKALVMLGDASKHIGFALVYTFAGGVVKGPFYLTLTGYSIGNSIVMTMKMLDNYSVGYKINEIDVAFGQNGAFLENVSYTDEYGNFTSIQMEIYHADALDNKNYNPPLSNEWESNFIELIKNSQKLPVFDTLRRYYSSESSYTNYNPILSNLRVLQTGYRTRFKDNREITAENIQLHIIPDDGIIITNLYHRATPFLYSADTDTQYKIAYSFIEVYNKNDRVAKGTVTVYNENMRYLWTDNKLYLTSSTINTTFYPTYASSITSWAICDDKNNILVAVNANATIPIYINRK